MIELSLGPKPPEKGERGETRPNGGREPAPDSPRPVPPGVRRLRRRSPQAA